MTGEKDRRTEARITPPSGMQAKVKSTLPARVLDVSTRGMQVEIASHLRPDSDCELRLQLEDGAVTLRAWVRRCRAWGFGLDPCDRKVLLYRAGLEFAESSADAIRDLRDRLFPFPTSPTPAVTSGPLADEHGDGPMPPSESAEGGAGGGGDCQGESQEPVSITINAEDIRRVLADE